MVFKSDQIKSALSCNTTHSGLTSYWEILRTLSKWSLMFPFQTELEINRNSIPVCRLFVIINKLHWQNSVCIWFGFAISKYLMIYLCKVSNSYFEKWLIRCKFNNLIYKQDTTNTKNSTEILKHVQWSTSKHTFQCSITND